MAKDNYKVLHITTIDFTIKKMLIDKLDQLKKYGYDIETMSDNTGLSSSIGAAGYVHHEVKISRTIKPFEDIKSLLNVFSFLKTNNYDIVHTHTAKAGVIGRIAARLAGVPIVVHTSHGLPFYRDQSRLKNIIYKNLELIASRFSDGYFSQNHEDLNEIKSIVANGSLIGYEGNGVVLQKIDNHPKLSPDEKARLRKQLGVDNDSFLFLMGARFEKVKNHQMLIQALAEVSVKYPYNVLLAGEGPLLEQVQRKVEIYGLNDKVKFLGFRDDILDLLQVVDAVILTSEKEGIPRIIMEAMSLGTPVLATDVLGTRELVVNGQTGELLPLNDHEKLARRIEFWMNPNSKGQLQKYVFASRKRIEKEFTEEIVASRIHKFYQQLIELKGI